MRSIWSGAINFGLLYIPVRLFNASQENQLSFNLLRKSDLCPIRYVRVCQETGEEVPFEAIVRGYEYEKGHYVILEDEDFRRANVRKTQTLSIVSFTDEAEIEEKFMEKPFYLEPEKGSERAYVLLREALKKSGKVGIARFVLRTREHLGILKAEDDFILLNQMRFASELRPTEGLEEPEEEAISDRELDLAVRLIEQLSEPWEPEAYKDTYTEDLKRIIQQKVEGLLPETIEEEPYPAEVTDLFIKLTESLQAAKEKNPQR